MASQGHSCEHTFVPWLRCPNCADWAEPRHWEHGTNPKIRMLSAARVRQVVRSERSDDADWRATRTRHELRSREPQPKLAAQCRSGEAPTLGRNSPEGTPSSNARNPTSSLTSDAHGQRCEILTSQVPRLVSTDDVSVLEVQHCNHDVPQFSRRVAAMSTSTTWPQSSAGSPTPCGVLGIGKGARDAKAVPASS